ncbi:MULTISPECIES: hypothetical protein [Bacteroidota]
MAFRTLSCTEALELVNFNDEDFEKLAVEGVAQEELLQVDQAG